MTRRQVAYSTSSGGGASLDATARSTATAAQTQAAANKTALDALTPEVIDAPNIVTDDAAKTITFPLKSGGNQVVDVSGMFTGLASDAAGTTFDDATAALGAGNVQQALNILDAAVDAQQAALAAEIAATDVEIANKADKTEVAAEKTRNDNQDTRLTSLEALQVADRASIDALNLSQTAQDTLIASLPTNAQITALQTQITANVDDSPTGFVRNPDNSITVSWETQADTTLAAATVQPDPAMVGATAVAAGEQGDVPAPAAGDESKALFGDGTWKEVASEPSIIPWQAGAEITANQYAGIEIPSDWPDEELRSTDYLAKPNQTLTFPYTLPALSSAELQANFSLVAPEQIVRNRAAFKRAGNNSTLPISTTSFLYPGRDRPLIYYVQPTQQATFNVEAISLVRNTNNWTSDTADAEGRDLVLAGGTDGALAIFSFNAAGVCTAVALTLGGGAAIALQTAIRDAATAVDTDAPTEKAVRTELDLKADQTALAQEVLDRQAADNLKLDIAEKADAAALAAGTVDKWVDAAAYAALQSLFTGGNVGPAAATFAALPAVPADASATKVYWTGLTADDGANLAGIYTSNGGAWTFFMAVPNFAQDPTPAAAPGAADAATPYLHSRDDLDAWGQSRRVQRIFDVDAVFDYPALGYADRTAIYVRNRNNASGIGYTYRTDNTVSLELRRADGTLETDFAGVNDFNVQPAEIVFGEKDGNVFRASIIPGERVKHFFNDAAANAYGPMPHDSIVTIRSTGSIGFRKTGTNAVNWPADGKANDDWWIFEQPSAINPDDVAEWSATETDVALGDLRKFVVGAETLIFARSVVDTAADGGTEPDPLKWQDITALDPNVPQIFDSTGGGNRIAVWGDPARIIVQGNEAVTVAFPTQGGTNANKSAIVQNDTDTIVTVEGEAIPAKGVALLTTDGDVGGPTVTVLGGEGPTINGITAELLPVQVYDGGAPTTTVSLGTLAPGKYRYLFSTIVWREGTVGQMGARVNVKNASDAVIGSHHARLANNHSLEVYQTLPLIVVDFEITVEQECTAELLSINANGVSMRSIAGARYVDPANTENLEISTVEVATGRQWNGKDVFRRQFTSTTYAGGDEAVVAGIDQVLSVQGQVGGNNVLVAPVFWDGTRSTRWYVAGGSLFLGASGFGSYQGFDLVVEYTKA